LRATPSPVRAEPVEAPWFFLTQRKEQELPFDKLTAND
jgi:hypothetical protein